MSKRSRGAITFGPDQELCLTLGSLATLEAYYGNKNIYEMVDLFVAKDCSTDDQLRLLEAGLAGGHSGVTTEKFVNIFGWGTTKKLLRDLLSETFTEYMIGRSILLDSEAWEQMTEALVNTQPGNLTGTEERLLSEYPGDLDADQLRIVSAKKNHLIRKTDFPRGSLLIMTMTRDGKKDYPVLAINTHSGMFILDDLQTPQAAELFTNWAYIESRAFGVSTWKQM